MRNWINTARNLSITGGLREVEKLLHTRFGRFDYNPDGIHVFDEDWDNLIILDAARYDVFKERAYGYLTLRKKTSRGSATPEWVRANFDRELHDVVYITGNGWFNKLRGNLRGEVHDLDFVTAPNPADVPENRRQIKEEKLNRVTQRSKEAASQYPRKRLMVHYGAPHRSFLGETYQTYLEPYSPEYKPPGVSRSIIQQAYAETFEIVFDEAMSLVDGLSGKTVISSDHGEMLGERHRYVKVRDYGHFERIYNEYLVTVPWCVVNDDERRRIESEEPEAKQDYDQEKVDKTLRLLGYKV